MVQFEAPHLIRLARAIAMLEGAKVALGTLAKSKTVGTTDAGQPVSINWCGTPLDSSEAWDGPIRKALEQCREATEALGLSMTRAQTDRVEKMLEHGGFDGERLIAALSEVLDRAHDELKSAMCFRLLPSRHHYFVSINPFGEGVAARFPNAAYDIKEASRCLAVERWTACVLHLMRALEVGLHELAGVLGVVNTSREQWKTLIDQLEKSVREMERRPDKPNDWRNLRDAYSSHLVQLGIFKDAWRNHAMHARQIYDENSAVQIYGAVKAFFERLALELRSGDGVVR